MRGDPIGVPRGGRGNGGSSCLAGRRQRLSLTTCQWCRDSKPRMPSGEKLGPFSTNAVQLLHLLIWGLGCPGGGLGCTPQLDTERHLETNSPSVMALSTM